MLELIIVRHGESIRNFATKRAHEGDFSLIERQLKEEIDEAPWPLTEDGHEQARVAGQWIAGHGWSFDAGYVSPFKRTLETAEGLGLGLTFTVEERLRERQWGDYSKLEYSPKQYLADLARCGSMDWHGDWPNSECINDLVPSSRELIEDLQARHPMGRIILVTHGGRMGAIENVLEGVTPARHFANCCVLHYRLFGDGGEVRIDYPAQPEFKSQDWAPFTRPTK